MYDICEKAAEKNIGVLIDAEESWIQDPIDRLSVEMMEVFNREKCIVFNTIQLYRHDRLNFLKMSDEHLEAKRFYARREIGARRLHGKRKTRES